METLPSKIDPEIYPPGQDTKLCQDDFPEIFGIAFTQKEIDLFFKLIDKDDKSVEWNRNKKRIVMLIRSIAYQLRTYSELKIEYLPRRVRRKWQNDQKISYTTEKFTRESPFV